MKSLPEVLKDGEHLAWTLGDSRPSLYFLRVQPEAGRLSRIDEGATTVMRASRRSFVFFGLSGGHLPRSIGEIAEEAALRGLEIADDARDSPCGYGERLFSWIWSQMSDGGLLYRCIVDAAAGMLVAGGGLWLLRIGANGVYSGLKSGLGLMSEDSRQVVLEERGEWPKMPFESPMSRLVDNTLSPYPANTTKGFEAISCPVEPAMILGRGLMPFHPLPTKIDSFSALLTLEAGWRHGLTGFGAIVGFDRPPGPPFQVERLDWVA